MIIASFFFRFPVVAQYCRVPRRRWLLSGWVEQPTSVRWPRPLTVAEMSAQGGEQDALYADRIDRIREWQRGAKAMTDSAAVACAQQRPRQAAGVQCGASCVIVNLCALLIGADMAVLPAAYREIGDELSITPEQLGMISLAVGISSNVASLLPALCRASRPALVAGSCFLWAITAALMGLSQTYEELLYMRAANGVGVGIIFPLLFSLIADMNPEDSRGKAFGILCFTQSLGGTIGGWLSTVISAQSHVQLLPGVPAVAGWRVSCFGLCAVGIVLGLLMLLCGGGDPRPIDGDHHSSKEPAAQARPTLADHLKIVKIPTFQVIVAQGCFGNLPWAAWNFATLWLELNCFSNTMAATIVATYTFAQAIGQPFGGWLGDWWAARSPNYGRPLLAIVSVGLGIPCVFGFFILLPQGDGNALAAAVPYIGVAFVFGFAMSWTLAGTNAPIYSEIVPVEQRTLVYGLDNAYVPCSVPHTAATHNSYLTLQLECLT
eukprot:COSAG06_NODE_9_length_37879_cov_13.349735_15_plen_491_part_00